MGRKRKNKKLKIWQLMLLAPLLICILIYGYMSQNLELEATINNDSLDTIIDLSTIPEYSGSPYVEINHNIPYFTEEDYTTRKL